MASVARGLTGQDWVRAKDRQTAMEREALLRDASPPTIQDYLTERGYETEDDRLAPIRALNERGVSLGRPGAPKSGTLWGESYSDVRDRAVAKMDKGSKERMAMESARNTLEKQRQELESLKNYNDWMKGLTGGAGSGIQGGLAGTGKAIVPAGPGKTQVVDTGQKPEKAGSMTDIEKAKWDANTKRLTTELNIPEKEKERLIKENADIAATAEARGSRQGQGVQAGLTGRRGPVFAYRDPQTNKMVIKSNPDEVPDELKKGYIWNQESDGTVVMVGPKPGASEARYIGREVASGVNEAQPSQPVVTKPPASIQEALAKAEEMQTQGKQEAQVQDYLTQRQGEVKAARGIEPAKQDIIAAVMQNKGQTSVSQLAKILTDNGIVRGTASFTQLLNFLVQNKAIKDVASVGELHEKIRRYM